MLILGNTSMTLHATHIFHIVLMLLVLPSAPPRDRARTSSLASGPHQDRVATPDDSNSNRDMSQSDSSTDGGVVAAAEQPNQDANSSSAPIPALISAKSGTVSSPIPEYLGASTAVDSSRNGGPAPADGAEASKVSKKPTQHQVPSETPLVPQNEPLERNRDGANEEEQNVEETPWWSYHGHMAIPPVASTSPKLDNNEALPDGDQQDAARDQETEVVAKAVRKRAARRSPGNGRCSVDHNDLDDQRDVKARGFAIY